MQTRYWLPDPKVVPKHDVLGSVSPPQKKLDSSEIEKGSLAFARVECEAKQLAILEDQLSEAAQLLKDGEVVAFPTETVYGLGGDATNTEAIAKIYAAKGRPSDNPLIVHIATRAQLERLVTHIPPIALPLMDAFWPGPLTLVLPASAIVSPRVTAGLSTVAIRMPSHPIALALIKKSDVVVAAPSANASGRPSPTCAKHVADDLDGRISGIVDGALLRTRLLDAVRDLHTNSKQGSEDVSLNSEANEMDSLDSECAFGVESTVLDISQFCNEDKDEIVQAKAYILRPGAVTKQMLERILDKGKVEYDVTLPIDPSELFTEQSHGLGEETKIETHENYDNKEAALRAELASRTNALLDDRAKTAIGSSTPKAPGMKYVHYAPKAPLYIVVPSNSSPSSAIWSHLRATQGLNHIGLLLTGESFQELGLNKLASSEGVLVPSFLEPRLELKVNRMTGKAVLKTDARFVESNVTSGNDDWICVTALHCGSRSNITTVSVRLYDALREFDSCEVDAIYSESLNSSNEGAAVMNRLLKAAGGKVVRVEDDSDRQTAFD